MHPNLIPVDVSNIGRLVEEMKQICRADPEEEEIPGSATVEGAYMRAVRVQQDIIESGHLRILRIDSRLVSTFLTLDRYTSTPRWDLSLSIPNFRGVEPFPVPNATAKFIARAFLGPNFQEIPPIAAFKTVKQFVADAPEEA